MTEAPPVLQTLRMVRRFEASPARVFEAWTDPDLAARWLFTGPDSESHTTEIDLKVGGRWEIVDRRGGVDTGRSANTWRSSRRAVSSSASACRSSLRR